MRMTKTQRDAFADMTDLQQNVALRKIEGFSDADAYRLAGGKANEKSFPSAVSMVCNHPKVKAFLALMLADRVKESIATREEIAELLTSVIRTNVNDVVDFVDDGKEMMDLETGETVVVGQSQWRLKDPSDMPPGAMKAISEVTAGKKGLTIKMMDKATAAKQLAALQGYDAPKRTEVSGPGGRPIETKDLNDEEFNNRLVELGIIGDDGDSD